MCFASSAMEVPHRSTSAKTCGDIHTRVPRKALGRCKAQVSAGTVRDAVVFSQHRAR
jgi:hypothetical protein